MKKYRIIEVTVTNEKLKSKEYKIEKHYKFLFFSFWKEFNINKNFYNSMEIVGYCKETNSFENLNDAKWICKVLNNKNKIKIKIIKQ
jgi:hypothetical protein